MRETIKQIFLQSNHKFISGESLSKELKISRTAVWKQIEELKKEGYQFEAVRKKGYRLINHPDDLFPELITNQLRTKWLGKEIIYNKEVESTQKIAHEFAKNGVPNGTIVIANAQTAGKGRLGRSWTSEKGKGLWFSMIIRPDFSYQKAPLITLFTSLVIFESIRKLYDLDIKIKWPNDIYVNEKKCGGILTEIHGEHDKIHYIIIGIGINTHLTSFPDDIKHKAVSIEEALKTTPKRLDLLTEIISYFEEQFEVFSVEGFTPFFKKYNEWLLWKNKKIFINQQNEEISGINKGINADGFLLLEKDNGETIKIVAGDIQV